MRTTLIRKGILVDALTALALAALTVLAFLQAGGFGLINCDDLDYLVETPAVFGVENSIWMPLTWISYRVETLLGFDAGMRHLTSVGVHAVNAVLLYVFLRRLFPKSAWGALVAAFVWAVHPLRAESVVWLASRKDVLSTLFLLVSLIAWHRGGRCGVTTALVAVALGAAAKPSVMVFPVFALAVDFLVVRRRKPTWAYAAAFVLAGVIALEATLAQGAGGACAETEAIPLWYRLVNAVAAMSVYLGNEIAQEGMAIQCMIRWPAAPRHSNVGLCALVVLALYLWKGRNLSVRAGFAVFLASLLPFLGIVGFGYHAFADRFTILPAIGLSLSLAAFFESASDCRRRTVRMVVLGLGIAFCGRLFCETRRQTALWADDETVFGHTVEVDGAHNRIARLALAIHAYEVEHDMEKVSRHFLEIRKEEWDEVAGVGALFLEALLSTGRRETAAEYFDSLSAWDSKEVRRLKARGEWDDTSGGTWVYQMADILRLAFAEDPELRKVAGERLAGALKSSPKDPTARCVAYRLALLDGRSGEAERLAARDVEGDAYMRNRWAEKPRFTSSSSPSSAKWGQTTCTP